MNRAVIGAMFREVEQIAQFAGLASKHTLDAGERYSKDQGHVYALYRLTDVDQIRKLCARIEAELASDPNSEQG
jgi:hypothetical protein